MLGKRFSLIHCANSLAAALALMFPIHIGASLWNRFNGQAETLEIAICMFTGGALIVANQDAVLDSFLELHF